MDDSVRPPAGARRARASGGGRGVLLLLLLFALCTAVAIVLSGRRPGLEQGLAPGLVQFAGYAFALVAAGLLLVSPDDGDAGSARRAGGVVLGALMVLVLMVLVLLDLLAADGPNIGAGAVQMVGIIVIMVVTIRLALGVAAERAR